MQLKSKKISRKNIFILPESIQYIFLEAVKTSKNRIKIEYLS